MAPPRSQLLVNKEKAASQPHVEVVPEKPVRVYKTGETIKIKPVKCYNDFVAILQFRVESTVLIAGPSGFKNEGMVVGVGPGVVSGNGNRCPSQVQLGDVVSFYGNPTTTIEPQSGPYADQKIVVVTERFLVVGLKPVKFVIVEGTEES